MTEKAAPWYAYRTSFAVEAPVSCPAPTVVRSIHYHHTSRRRTISRPTLTPRVNERIRIREVRVIDEEGEQIGVLATREALDLARSKGLDLVEVAPNVVPPVCRIMDYGKHRYEQGRRERESRKNQHVVELKEIRIQPKIDDHDVETKARQAAKFLDNGDRVKLTVRFRGREMAHPDIGRGLLDKFAEILRSTSTIEATPRMEGRTMTMHLAPVKAKQSQQEREALRTGKNDSASEQQSDVEDIHDESDETNMASALRAAEPQQNGMTETDGQAEAENP